jgi:hypothetical protein
MHIAHGVNICKGRKVEGWGIAQMSPFFDRSETLGNFWKRRKTEGQPLSAEVNKVQQN